MLSVDFSNNQILFNEKRKQYDLEITCDLLSNNLTAEAIDDNHNETVVDLNEQEKYQYLAISTNIQEKRKMVTQAIEKLEDLKDQYNEVLNNLKQEIEQKEIKALDIDSEMINGLTDLRNPLNAEIQKIKTLKRNYYGV